MERRKPRLKIPFFLKECGENTDFLEFVELESIKN